MIRVLAIAALLLGAVPSAALANEGGGGLISLDKSIVIQMINFGLLLFILIKLLYKPLLAKMEERTQAIRKSLEEAQAARAEARRSTHADWAPATDRPDRPPRTARRLRHRRRARLARRFV